MDTVFKAFEQAEARYPTRPFLCTPPGEAGGAALEHSYRDTLAAVRRLADAYRRAGYGPGHRVALMLPTGPRFVLHYLALNALGASAVPVNADFRVGELAYLLGHSAVSLIVGRNAYQPIIAASIAENGRPVAFHVDEGEALSDLPAELPLAPSAAGTTDPGIETECAILYTSGTTGRPKGCIITNGYCLTAGDWANRLGGAMQVAAEGERLISPFPFTHMTALAVGLTSVILGGGCLILPDRFHPARWWDDCIATGATRMYYLGLVIPLLMKAPPAPQDRAHRLKVAAGGGVDPVLHAAFEERFGFPLIEVWGMTETGRIIAGTEEPRQVHTRAFGRSRPELEARVAGEGDEEAPVGQPGELLVRHSAEAPRLGFFAGYLKDPEATEEAWRGGWFHTGDIVRRDEAGTLYFIDRRKNIVRRSGENIAAAEVETRLIEHPAVQSVGVTACPDPLRDEEVAAFIVLKPGTEPSEAVAHQLFDWCYARLAYFKAPGWISFLEELPVTGTQKVKKGELLKPGEMLMPGPTTFDLRALKRPGA